ncbi:unnamed protein product [Paramecium sonneborni]|uniref:Uncharacterized protein n=1 Tax=Paramecium sonneborni TaxID=65129 RepID=A0A8S1QVI8_9CILI|nr:unnamed protein product [Paramecium sonneborni]
MDNKEHLQDFLIRLAKILQEQELQRQQQQNQIEKNEDIHESKEQDKQNQQSQNDQQDIQEQKVELQFNEKQFHENIDELINNGITQQDSENILGQSQNTEKIKEEKVVAQKEKKNNEENMEEIQQEKQQNDEQDEEPELEEEVLKLKKLQQSNNFKKYFIRMEKDFKFIFQSSFRINLQLYNVFISILACRFISIRMNQLNINYYINQLMDAKSSQNMMLNMREQFRQEIRKKDQESFFQRKRLNFQQSSQLPDIQLDQAIPQIKECLLQKNLIQLGLLHQVVFKLINDNVQNEVYFLNNQYLELSIQSIQFGSLICYQVLTNLCLNPLYPNNPISQVLITKAVNLIGQVNLQFENVQQNLDPKISQAIEMEQNNKFKENLENQYKFIFFFLGNIISQQKLQYLNLLPNLLQIGSIAEGQFLTSVIFLLNSIIEHQQIDSNQRYIGLKIIVQALRKEQCEEYLMPLGNLYNSQFDELLLQSNVFETIINHHCTMVDKCLAIIKQFTLSDSLLVAHKLLDLKILDKLLQNLNNKSQSIRKESYLILSNLSFNDNNAALKIINHPILFKIIENIIASTNEKSYCMSVILNLQATGDEIVSKKLLDIGFIQIICSFLDINEVGLIKQLLDSILRLLLIQNVKEQLRQYNFKIKLDKILQDFDDKMIQDLHGKIIQLL